MQFSVIIPIYNLEGYIEKCIDSVLNQSFHDYEIILVNDGSTDTSKKICQNYVSENIILINKENGGLSDARNIGIKNSSGDYLLFLDGDDFWSEKNFLEELNKIINDDAPDLIVFPLSYYYNSNNIKFNCFNINYDKTLNFSRDFQFLVNHGIYTPSACNKCIKRNLLDSYELYFPIGRLSEDIQWCGRLLEYVNDYYIYNKVCYMYRQNRVGSITHRVSEKNILHILGSIDEGISTESKVSDDLKLRNLELYFSYSFIELIPYVNPYLDNKIIVSLLSKYKYLIKYGFSFNDKKKKIISITVSLFGFYVSSVCLNFLVRIYRIFNK
ncbi:hypothetical protein A1D29_02710 [Pasteurellaceae bacterium Orientalotternb1]|nr:hypothetical protein A1D29_02710 [Pasteurellaceae bacterium Orientalotternb1]